MILCMKRTTKRGQGKKKTKKKEKQWRPGKRETKIKINKRTHTHKKNAKKGTRPEFEKDDKERSRKEKKLLITMDVGRKGN